MKPHAEKRNISPDPNEELGRKKLRPTNSTHHRSKQREFLDFAKLAEGDPTLQEKIIKSDGSSIIDFNDYESFVALTSALFKYYYAVNWSLPMDRRWMCPALPGRADYIHTLADLLAVDEVPVEGPSICGLDIGCGANFVYCILGFKEYGWRMVGSEVDKEAVEHAEELISKNKDLQEFVEVRQNPSSGIFKGVVNQKEKFSFCCCNPPFYSSMDDAIDSNSGLVATESETVTEGGELSFISKMVEESLEFQTNFLYFSSLVSKKSNLKKLLTLVRSKSPTMCKAFEIKPGVRARWILVWSFRDPNQIKNLLRFLRK